LIHRAYTHTAAEAESKDTPPTQDDIARIIHIIKDRDAEMRLLRDDLHRISEENRKLREEVLPLVKQAKDRNQPLPTPGVEDYQQSEQKSGSSLSRKFSTKRLFLSNSKPNNLSPTTIQEGRMLQDSSSLDPSPAAMSASSHLTASMSRDGPGGNSPNQPQPSPTSPAYSTMQPPNSAGPPSRPFGRSDENMPGRWDSTYSSASTIREKLDPPLSGGSVATPNSGNSTSSRQDLQTPGGSTQQSSSSRGENPQVEIFKSFRVSIDDPCHKVLPVALKKYNITADWRQYALYIVHGDQERCLGLNERPLILFKQLDREGRKPMFMLRKHASPMEGSVSTIGAGNGMADAIGVNPGGGGRGVQLPGGVL
jgi:hypothetical protein